MGTAEAQQTPGNGPPWFNDSFDYRILLDVEAFQFEAVNHPVEVELNITAMVGTLGFKLDKGSLLLIEYTGPGPTDEPIKQKPSGDIFGLYGVPFRFYPMKNYESSKNARFTMTWLLDGTTRTNRYYMLYFSDLPSTGPGMFLPPPDDPKTFGMIDSNYWIQRGMVFYGFSPGEQTDWPQVDQLESVGLYNNTTVSVFNITDKNTTPSLLVTKMIDRGTLWRYEVPDGTYFKIASNKPMLTSISSAMSGGGSAKTFYPSSDRNIVGRDFIIAPYTTTNWTQKSFGQQIYALGDARVSIRDISGKHIKELDVRKDFHAQLLELDAGTVYHITSSDDILIEQEAINGFTSIPTVTGAPVGRKFFGSIQPFDCQQITVQPYQDSKVEVWDLDRGVIVSNKDVLAGVGYTDFTIGPGVFKIESTGDISVMLGSCEGGKDFSNIGDDISFLGSNGGRNTYGYAINNPGPGEKDHQYPGPYYGGLVFPFFNNTEIKFKGGLLNLSSGQYLGLQSSSFEILSSTRPISCMILGRGYTEVNTDHRWNDWGSYLAGGLISPNVHIGLLQQVSLGIDMYPSPTEGSTNDTMVHAVEPGQTTVFRISIKDIGTQPESVKITQGPVPTGWTANLDMLEISIDIGQVTEVHLTVTVPLNEPKDKRVNISIRGETVREPSERRNDTIYAEVVVDPVYYPDLDGETVKYVDPGQTAIFNIKLTNLGNAHDEITIKLSGQVIPGWSVDLSTNSASLDPSMNTSLKLNTTAPKDARAGTYLIMDIISVSAALPNRTDVHRTITIVNTIHDFDLDANYYIEILPGTTGRVNFSIKNLGNGPDHFTAKAKSETGLTFEFIEPGAELDIESGQSMDHAFMVSVPGKDLISGLWLFSPGNRTVLFNVTDGAGTSKELPITIMVLQIFSVSLTAEQDELFIKANEVGRYVLLIKNTGNGNDTFTMKTDAHGTLEKDRVSLGPGQSQRINVTVPPPGNREQTYGFDATARSTKNAEAKVSLILHIQYPKQATTVANLNCLWILLVVLLVYAIVKLIQKKVTKRWF